MEGEGLGRYDVMDDLSEVAQQSWDQVWLCVASTALTESWLAELAGAIGSATLVSLTPGLEDKDRICRFVPEEQVVLGMIPFMSFQAPLPGSTRNVEPGVAWYVPPFSPHPFPSRRATRLGGLCFWSGAGDRRRVMWMWVGRRRRSLRFSAYLIALELADWRFRTVRKARRFEACSKRERKLSKWFVDSTAAAPSARLVESVGFAKAVTYGGPLAPSYDLETFLRVHFSKVGSQTMAMLETWCERAQAADLPHDALDALRESLMEWRARPGADT